MKFNKVLSECGMAGDMSGAPDPHMVDWASRPGGPQTDLGKRAMKKKKKGVIKRKLYPSGDNRI